ncbi:IS110 family RNA-guided transposase [Phaeocystidibacter luteus]|uniref:IS110 family transposase n=1 Tax=Phaeocystidibacter luteus TaxID=911197 RepID=A0A6N6RCE8_9FLAO|nr:IS110 family transposase [Phaeocystidibacter luteus]KAB2804285.1 IS110 family transposase [Phaeocystidibacter luteus]
MWKPKLSKVEQSYFIGVDVSKNKVDIAVIARTQEVVLEREVPNTDVSLKRFFGSLIKQFAWCSSDVLICCETTGIYSNPLKRVTLELGLKLWVEHAMKVKRASTDMRGKDDRTDARRIAEYALRYSDRKRLYVAESTAMKRLGTQGKIRNTLLKKRTSLENELREAKAMDIALYRELKAVYGPVISSLNRQLKKVEEVIRTLVKQDEDIRQNMKLLQSIPGVGEQVSLHLILRTNNFKSISSPKQLACYAGVAPFKNESGVKIKRARVSHMADKQLKKILHLAAMAAIRSKGELNEYYQRKTEEGKNKMSTINAVRNKIIHRVYAVVERQSPYQIKLEI